MIEDDKRPLTRAWLARDAKRRLERSFSVVRAQGIARLEATLDARGAALVASNHTAWWDPIAALYLTSRLRCDAYALMDAKNLRRLPFFRHVGAFGVDLGDPRDGARAVRHATKLLSRPRALVWIFAPGREVPVTARPIGARGGAAAIARAAKIDVVPIALRYELASVERPELWISIGDPVPWSRDVEGARAAHDEAIAAELDRIDRALVTGRAEAFAELTRAPERLSFRIATSALAWLARSGLLP